MDDGADRDLQILQLHADIACLLADPSRVRSGGAGGEDHAPALNLNENQCVEEAEQRRVDHEKVGRDDRAGLGAQELTPGKAAAPWGRTNSMPPENQPDGGVGYPMAKFEQLSLDSALAPTGIVLGQSQDQIPDLIRDRWSSVARAW